MTVSKVRRGNNVTLSQDLLEFDILTMTVIFFTCVKKRRRRFTSAGFDHRPTDSLRAFIPNQQAQIMELLSSNNNTQVVCTRVDICRLDNHGLDEEFVRRKP
jgi:hypothetical protein